MKAELSEVRVRLNKFNDLLNDIYGRKIWLGQVLVKTGVSSKQIRTWKEDPYWLLGFLNNLERRLITDLQKVFANDEIEAFRRWYGFDQEEYLKVPPAAQRTNEDTKYLKTLEGQKMFETAVSFAAQTAHYIYAEFQNTRYVWDGNIWFEDGSFVEPPQSISRKLDQLLSSEIESDDENITDTEILLARAQHARDSTQYERAIALTHRVLALDPKTYSALAILSSTLRAQGKPEEALRETAEFEDVLYPPLQSSRAAALCDLGEWRKAKKVVGRILALKGGSEETFSVVHRIKSERPDLYKD
ncbi:MAG: hypothetical protein RBT47_08640 [Anaerolineae bacterium]|jgi:tetratricopeptide (TPR) repeat protein|nr:hypothetical protein [Anaerolineae bacterium]